MESTPLLVDERDPVSPARRILDIASWPPARRNLWLLAGVAVCFGLLEMVTLGLRYPYSTDEAIYLSRLNPGVPDYGWDAWRAWGMPVLGAPVTLMDAPLPAVRLYFVVLASVGVFLAFRPWLASFGGPLVPIAAALFGSTAVAVYNGSLALPNLYSALAAVAATGYFVACRRGAGNYRRSVLGLAVAIAFAALVRPSDSLWLAMSLFLAWLGLRAWRRPATGAAIVAGQIVGWAPWVVESFFRFGGPVARMRISSDALGGTHLYPDLAMVRLYVKLWSSGSPQAVSLNVPIEFRGGAATVASVRLAPVDLVAKVWWFVAACVIVTGVVGAVRARRTAEATGAFMIPLIVGLSVAFPYLFMMRYGQLRFLLPVAALLALPVAYGLLQLGRLRVPGPRLLGPGLVMALVLGLAGAQVPAALRNRVAISRADAAFSTLVDRLREMGVSKPCVIAGSGRFTIGYQLGCQVVRDIPGSREPVLIVSARAEGKRVAVVQQSPPSPGGFLDRWRPVEVEIPGQTRIWTVFLPPA